MAAKFYAVGSFLIRSRNLFVIVGAVTEGEVEAGMMIRVPLGNLAVGSAVAAIEVIDVSYMNQSFKGLVVAFEDPGELEFWQSLDLSDETLEVDRDEAV